MRSVEPAGRMRQHGVDLAGFRGEIGARHHLTAVVPRNLVEQTFELADVAVDRLLELAVRTILLADIVEGLLALQCIEPAGENVALTALVAIPQVCSRVVVDHSGDVDGKRIQRLNRMPGRSFFVCARGA